MSQVRQIVEVLLETKFSLKNKRNSSTTDKRQTRLRETERVGKEKKKIQTKEKPLQEFFSNQNILTPEIISEKKKIPKIMILAI